MLDCQKHLFDLDDEVVYLNGAYMSPQLKSVEAAGMQGLLMKNRPYRIGIDDFFQPVEELKKAFAKLIHAPDYQRIAIIPSVSYGIANAARNLPVAKGQKILLMQEQFPSNYYIWEHMALERGAKLEIISAPETPDRGDSWTERILQSIDNDTAVVAMAHVHWADGSVFDLKRVGEKARQVGAALVIDGTQSVGALPFDVQEFQPDALVCAGYKWLLGPYSIGVAYYGPSLDGGRPIEENWINRLDSHIFQNLVQYQPEYKPLAARYSVGEQSNFIHVPMLLASIRQILDWGVHNIQEYCRHISMSAIGEMVSLGAQVDTSPGRASHLFGVRLGAAFDAERLRAALQKHHVFVSFRGDAIRVAPHVYNARADFDVLVKCFTEAL